MRCRTLRDVNRSIAGLYAQRRRNGQDDPRKAPCDHRIRAREVPAMSEVDIDSSPRAATRMTDDEVVMVPLTRKILDARPEDADDRRSV